MKTPYLVMAMAISALLAGLFVFLYAQRGNQSPQPVSPKPTHVVQRFQLVAGEYEGIVLNQTQTGGTGSNSVPVKGVFRIDTETGRVWLFRDVVRSGTGLVLDWVVIGQENPNDPTS
jgi:hypothetical protein